LLYDCNLFFQSKKKQAQSLNQACDSLSFFFLDNLFDDPWAFANKSWSMSKKKSCTYVQDFLPRRVEKGLIYVSTFLMLRKH